MKPIPKILYLFVLFYSLSGCQKNYPNLGDVPDYKKPSISLEQAQKELAELKNEREHLKASSN